MRDKGSVARELGMDVGPVRNERSLAEDVSYDVRRVLYRKWIVAAIEFLLKVALLLLCGWLMWRGVKSFAPGEQAASAAVETSAVAAQETAASATMVTTGVAAPTVLAFLLAILLLPVVTISFIRTMVSKRSNGVNALTLAIYTAADFILAFFMVGASLETTGKAVVFIGVGIFSLLYNFTVMNYALKLEDGK